MSENNDGEKSKDRRRKAEAIRLGKADDRTKSSPEEVERLTHNLEVHQIELELQNEELREAQLELGLAKDDYTDLYDFAPVGYLSTDRDHIITKSNFLASQLLGVERQALTGQRFTHYIDRASMDIYYQCHKQVIETGGRQTCELVMHSADGGPFYARLEGVHSVSGELRIALIDITAAKLAEEKLRERSAQLAAANKELEAFAYSIAHDLRSPLRAIDGYSRMLLRAIEDKLDDEGKGRFATLRDNVRKMGQLIDDLLAFSRLGRQTMSLSVINMTALVSQLWAECRPPDPGRQLELRLLPLPEAYCDLGLVKQVLTNLLLNAIKFTQSQETAIIEIGGKEEEGQIVYYVKDNGVGFDMRYRDKLFGVFQRLHGEEEFEGTGVGLAIVQRIVHRHGGRIWAEGKVGEGACFFFTLPAPGGGVSTNIY